MDEAAANEALRLGSNFPRQSRPVIGAVGVSDFGADRNR
jgi:hypothetical protein